MPRHTLIKLTKTRHKERILKAAREKQQVTYKGKPIWLTADLYKNIICKYVFTQMLSLHLKRYTTESSCELPLRRELG